MRDIPAGATHWCSGGPYSYNQKYLKDMGNHWEYWEGGRWWVSSRSYPFTKWKLEMLDLATLMDNFIAREKAND